MKYICLGYMDEKKREAMTESEVNAFMDECFAYDDMLRENGHFVGGEALQSAGHTKALKRRREGVRHRRSLHRDERAVGRTDVARGTGLEPRVRFISNHPSVRMGSCWEIRPAADLVAMMAESQRRRAIKS